MEYIYTSFVFIISIIEAALFYHVVCRRKIVEITYKQLLPFIVLYIVQIFFVQFQVTGLLQNILIALLYYFVGVFITETNWLQNIKYWIICLLLSSVFEQIICQILEKHITVSENHYGFVNVITCILVTFILNVIEKVCEKKINEKEKTYSTKVFRIIVPIICAVTIGSSYIAYVMEEVNIKGKESITLFILLVAIIGVFIGIIVVLHLSQQKEHFEMLAKLENRYNQQQKAYFTMMLEKETETKRFRHDILNHLLCIQNQLEREQYYDAQSYVDSVLNEIGRIREMQYDVGNENVNVLLNYYLLPVRETCSILIEGYLGKLECISPMDLCTIISNLLKNAIEAIDTGGTIKVYFIRKEKYLQIKVLNTYHNIPQINKMGEIKTSKLDRENHGYGIANVKRVVDKNHGEFECYMQDNYFCVEIILPTRPFTTKNNR